MTDDTETPGRAPETDWEFALSAGDELVLAHLASPDAVSGDRIRARRAEVVVTVAAAAYDQAQADGLHGRETTKTPLGGMLRRLGGHGADLLAAAPATPGMGLEQQQQLLADAGELHEVMALAGDVVAGTKEKESYTIADWAAERRRQKRRRILEALDEEFGGDW